MKILMMVRLLPPAEVGGAERQCLRQAKALAARGHEVAILTQWVHAGSPRREERDGVTILRYGSLLPIAGAVRRLHGWAVAGKKARAAGQEPGRTGAFAPSRSGGGKFRWMSLVERPGAWSFLAEIRRALRRGRLAADVVHAHESLWIAGVAQWVAEELGAPAFCKEAFLPVLLFPGAADVPRAEEWKARRMRCRFVAMTADIRRELETAGISGERIVEIPNGVEVPAARAEPGAKATALYVGNISQGAAHKAFDVLLEAWGKAVAMEPGMRLRICGAGEAGIWREHAGRCGCGDTVVFEGSVKDVAAVHRECGYIVLPSRREGMSNALLEAMASGLPAVVSDIPGNLAVVEDGRSGLAVPAGDADALAQAMVRMYRSPEMRAEMGRAARKRIEERFEIGGVAERLEGAYRAALGGREPAAG